MSSTVTYNNYVYVVKPTVNLNVETFFVSNKFFLNIRNTLNTFFVTI